MQKSLSFLAQFESWLKERPVFATEATDIPLSRMPCLQQIVLDRQTLPLLNNQVGQREEHEFAVLHFTTSDIPRPNRQTTFNNVPRFQKGERHWRDGTSATEVGLCCGRFPEFPIWFFSQGGLTDHDARGGQGHGHCSAFCILRLQRIRGERGER